MTTPITQADREAAARNAVLVEMRELILAGRADHHAEPWAAHRIAAERETVERIVEWLRAGAGTDIAALETGAMTDTEAAPVADDPDIATIAYLAGAKDARDKLAALQAHVDALAGYAGHNYLCPGIPCTCGLSQTLRAYEAFKAASHD